MTAGTREVTDGSAGAVSALGVLLVVLALLDLTGLGTGVAFGVLLALVGFVTVDRLAGSSRAPAPGTIARFAALATVLVVLVTTAACAVLLPWTHWPQTRLDAVASVLLLQNWRLVLGEPAIAPVDPLTGPFQHLGIVAVIAQLVVTTALLVLAVGMVARRAPGRRAVIVGVALAAVVVLSSLRATAASGAPASSLDTTARAWEFALGGLVALVTARVRPGTPRWVSRWTPRWTLPPWIGPAGVALYLWLWPVLSLYLITRDRPSLGPRGTAVVLAVALALALGTHLVLHRPARSRGSRVTIVVATATVTVVVLTVCWYGVDTARPGWFAPVPDADHPGAAATLHGFHDEARAGSSVVPVPAARPTDWAGPGDQCRQSGLDPELRICATPQAAPRRTVVVVGDSHIQQLIPAVEPTVAEQRGRLVTMLRGACPFSATSDTVPGDEQCTTWNRAALREIVAMRPDLVVTLASRDVHTGLTEVTPPGFVEAWRALGREGIGVLAIRDNPRLPFNPVACFDSRPSDPSSCSAPRGTLLAADPPWSRAGPIPGNVTFVDPSDWYCTPTQCPPEIGNVLVYLDANHPSARFTSTMAPLVGRSLLGALNGSARGY